MEQSALQLTQHDHTWIRWHIDVEWMTYDLDARNITPESKTPLNLTLATVILPNYLRMAQIYTVHNTSV